MIQGKVITIGVSCNTQKITMKKYIAQSVLGIHNYKANKSE